MGGNRILYDGKAETRAAKLTAATFIDTIEAFEEMLEVLRLHALTVVAERKLVRMPAFVFHLRTDNLQPGGSHGVGNGIVDKISEDTVDETLVAKHLYLFLYVE